MDKIIGFGVFMLGGVLYMLVSSWLVSYRTDLKPAENIWRARPRSAQAWRNSWRILDPRNYTPAGRRRLPLVYVTEVIIVVGLWLIISEIIRQ